MGVDVMPFFLPGDDDAQRVLLLMLVLVASNDVDAAFAVAAAAAPRAAARSMSLSAAATPSSPPSPSTEEEPLAPSARHSTGGDLDLDTLRFPSSDCGGERERGERERGERSWSAALREAWSEWSRCTRLYLSPG